MLSLLFQVIVQSTMKGGTITLQIEAAGLKTGCPAIAK